MWNEMKIWSLHVIHLSSILNFLASDSMGLHSPAQAWESLSSAATSAISNEICCWKRKLSWSEKDRAFSKACQELTAMERGLHTRTVPLSSYCSAGSCFWSVCTRCQRRVFLNTVMNSITDSTATEASSCRTENWHSITEELLSESDCPMESYASNAPRKDSMHSAQECSVASTKIRHAERCQRWSRSHFLQEALPSQSVWHAVHTRGQTRTPSSCLQRDLCLTKDAGQVLTGSPVRGSETTLKCKNMKTGQPSGRGSLSFGWNVHLFKRSSLMQRGYKRPPIKTAGCGYYYHNSITVLPQ